MAYRTGEEWTHRETGIVYRVIRIFRDNQGRANIFRLITVIDVDGIPRVVSEGLFDMLEFYERTKEVEHSIPRRPSFNPDSKDEQERKLHEEMLHHLREEEAFDDTDWGQGRENER